MGSERGFGPCKKKADELDSPSKVHLIGLLINPPIGICRPASLLVFQCGAIAIQIALNQQYLLLEL